ncbi:hypothetical protein ACQ4PT_043808 [Festuca glaucescens]
MASLSVLFPAGLICFLHLFTIFYSLPLAICDDDETQKDREALLCFKSQLLGPAAAFASWSTNSSPEFCNWHGVTCSARRPRRVVGIDLESQGITGYIPACVANLVALTKLQLSNNSFHGAIPPELGLLSLLRNLNLSVNALGGNIPSQLSACSQLQILSLWKNSLQGVIPPSLGQCKHLQVINLGNNRLQGNIPSAFGDLPELRILVLDSNSLTGDIPLSLGSSSRKLTYVDLGMNGLTGVIPESLANSSSLQVLRLMSNSLTGEIPKALFNTSSLTSIYLQQNSLVGHIPSYTATSAPIKYIYLSNNYLSGRIPSSLGNLSSLLYLRLTQNNLIGSIPESLGHIRTLQVLTLSVNNLSGAVPPSLFNMSSLTFLGMANNSLIGRLPSNIGHTLPNIEGLILSTNMFDGTIPDSLTSAYHLSQLYLYNNSFTGFIPFFGSLPNLEEIDLSYNRVEGGNWGFLSSISNCSRLTMLIMAGNNLQGELPSSVGNLSITIQWLWLSENKISGPIPPEIGNLKSLTMLYMDYNHLTGDIPTTIGNLNSLVDLTFAQNRLSGQIPDNIGNLVQLRALKLDGNNLAGAVPASIGRCTQLQKLNLSHNSLDGSIPSKIFKTYLLFEEFDLSHNFLSGEVPEEVGNLINLKKISISNNRLFGNIVSTLGQCLVLEYLEMQDNFFVGSIPRPFVNLVGIKKMDISQNNLSGNIPVFLTKLSSLEDLNLSFNNFNGAVPRGGVFYNTGTLSLEGNDHLCTIVPTRGMPLCPALVGRKREHKLLLLVLGILMPIVVVVIIILSCIGKNYWRKRMHINSQLQRSDECIKKISYEDIISATNRFCPEHLIGSGSLGMVYKGSLQFQEDPVAIKIFKLDSYGADRSFNAECEALRNVRHRNIVKIITTCSSVDSAGADFKAIVFQYMPNGNLEMWLHPKGHGSERNMLTLSNRINIGLDVAFALDYLHNQCASPLIHCDLKPSNILLDHDMTAYVSDFGIARFHFTASNAYQDGAPSLAGLKGSIGYIPPEYGMSEEISTKGDVYSFGVLLLQMVTGCSPTGEKFNDSTTLHEYVDRAFSKSIHEVIDPEILQDDRNAADVIERCVIPLVRIALSCSIASPKARPEMGQVCNEILKIKYEASKMLVS